jgi:hypothetical protein
MTGVIDKRGQQWETCVCNSCGKLVKLQELKYERPSKEHEYGRDLCLKCYNDKEKQNEEVA